MRREAPDHRRRVGLPGGVGLGAAGGQREAPVGAAAVGTRRRAGTAVTLTEAPDVLTVDECAQLARTGPKPIYRAIANGELYGRRIGKQIRVPKRAFIAWLEGEGSGEVIALRVVEPHEGDDHRRRSPE